MDDRRLVLEPIQLSEADVLPPLCVARYGTASYENLASYLRSPSGVDVRVRCLQPPSDRGPGIVAYDREIRLYDRGGFPTRVERLAQRMVRVAWSAASGRLVTALATGEVIAWSPARGSWRVLDGASGWSGVAVRPDGAVCACAGGDALTLHSLETFEILRALTGTDQTIGSVLFADGGRIVVAASATTYATHDDDDSEVVAWDVETGALLWRRFIGGGDTSTIWLAEDGLRIAGGGTKDPSFVLNVRTGENASRDELVPPDELLAGPVVKGLRPVSMLDVSHDGRWIVTGEALWEVEGASCLLLPLTRGMPDEVRFAADATAVVRTLLGGEVERLRVPSLEVVFRGRCGDGYARDLLMPGGSLLVVVFQDYECAGGPERNHIDVFRAGDAHRIVTIEHPLTELVGLEPACDGTAFVGTAGRVAFVWTLPDGDRRAECSIRGGCVAAGPGGSRIAVTAQYQSFIEIVDTSSGHVVDRVETTGTVPSTCAFSPDGTVVAVAGADWVIRLQRLGNDRPPALLTGHLGAVKCLVFSPDGRKLFSGSSDFTVLAWDVEAALDAG